MLQQWVGFQNYFPSAITPKQTLVWFAGYASSVGASVKKKKYIYILVCIRVRLTSYCA